MITLFGKQVDVDSFDEGLTTEEIAEDTSKLPKVLRLAEAFKLEGGFSQEIKQSQLAGELQFDVLFQS